MAELGKGQSVNVSGTKLNELDVGLIYKEVHKK